MVQIYVFVFLFGSFEFWKGTLVLKTYQFAI
jgi:hypothetical protein